MIKTAPNAPRFAAVLRHRHIAGEEDFQVVDDIYPFAPPTAKVFTDTLEAAIACLCAEGLGRPRYTPLTAEEVEVIPGLPDCAFHSPDNFSFDVNKAVIVFATLETQQRLAAFLKEHA